LKQAVNNGQVSEDTINTKVMNILYQMERFGIMDRQVNPDHERNVTSDAHNAIARNVATEGIVLLKNENSILPMKSGSKVSVMGDPPVAGGGSGAVTGPHVIDGKTGVSNACPDCIITGDNQGADYIVYLIGTTSAEATDRPNLSLPSNDLNIIQGLIQKGMGHKLIVVVTNPGPVLLPFSKDVAAVMLCFMPGQEFGNAVGNVLFGVVNPSGKLPITIPNIENEMKMDQMQYPGVNGKTVYSEGLLVGYRWYDVNSVNPLYEFGFGLSYSSFSLSSDSTVGSDYSFTVDVTNDGTVDGAEVVQIYLVTPNADPSTTTPPKQDCDTMLKRMATDSSGTYSCGSRIDWLEHNKGMTPAEAYAEVAAEFPNICVCDNPPGPGPTPKPGNCADTYDQCGGSNWSGTTCCKGSCTCKFVNQWYSQCVPTSGNSCNGENRLLDISWTDEPKMKQLKAFEKVFVKAGETKTVKFQLKPRDFQSFDVGAGDWKTVSGQYTAYYGTSSRKLSGKFPITVSDSGDLVRKPNDITQIIKVGEEQNLYF